MGTENHSRKELQEELNAARKRLLELEERVAFHPTPPGASPITDARDRNNLDYLRTLLRTIPDMVWLKDSEGVFLMCNSAFEALLGVKEADIVGKTDYDFVDRDLADFFRQNDLKAMTADKPSTNEERLTIAATGYEGVFETIKTPMRTANGKLIGILGIARDITDRKRTEEALEKRMVSLTLPLNNPEGITFEELFNLKDLQRLQDEFALATGVASLITRPDGTPITRPSGFCDLCNIIRDTPKGKDNCFKSDALIGQLSKGGPTMRPCLSGGLWDAGAGISVGGRHVANWLIGQVRDLHQSEESMRAYAQDIDADEDQIVEAFRQVPTLTKERFDMVAQVLFTLANQLSTQAYQNLQQARFIFERQQAEALLVEMKDKAESANRSKSEFLANMSHEIRTPLNGVLGMLHLLSETEPTRDQQPLLDAAMTAANRLTRLLSDILDLSKVEAGKLQIVNMRFPLAGLKDSILELFRLAAREHGNQLDFLLHADVPPEVVGDEARLRQILFNLVGNAVKFTRDGEVNVEAAPLPAPPTGGVRILFTVRDTGIGITDEQLSLIFEPFVQGDGSYTRHFQGAGLGLPIVRKLVQLMDGELAIDNSSGTGTTVYLTLPFTLPEITAGTAATHPHELKTLPPQLRVLIVEDDKINLLYGGRALERLGHSVRTASNGVEALQRLSEEQFDLILMDIQMPVMNGLEASSAIRASKDIGPNAHIPIIAMTAYAMAGDREKFLSAGMDGYISKPMAPAELKRTITKAMERTE